MPKPSGWQPEPPKLYACVWCGDKKPITDMRHPGSSKGKAPSTCRACREAHPDQSWCDLHDCPHPIGRFVKHSGLRPGVFNNCIDVNSYKASLKREHAGRTCVSCRIEQESWFFRGGRQKSPVCRMCEEGHPDERWCLDCDAWLPTTEFHRTGVDGRFWTVRCKPCKVAHAHGTTVAELLRRQGTIRPECAACGDTENLHVDHDHGCCPAESGCAKCVRGYLCRCCNRAEGLLRTADRALGLAAYMRKHGR